MENKIEEVKQQKAVKNMENVKTYSVEEILKIISQAGNDKKKLPRDIIMLLENMQNISKAENKDNTEKNMAVGSIGYIEGLSLEDIKAINEYAAKQVENYLKAQFDINNPAHREYFEYFKQQALKEKEKQIKMKKFDESLHEKYGEMYERAYMKNMVKCMKAWKKQQELHLKVWLLKMQGIFYHQECMVMWKNFYHFMTVCLMK